MPPDQRGAAPVIDTDRVDRAGRQVADEDGRHPKPRQLVQKTVEREIGDDQPVDPAAPDLREVLAPVLCRVAAWDVGVEDERVEPLPLEP